MWFVKESDKDLLGASNSGHRSVSFHGDDADFIFPKHGDQRCDEFADAIFIEEICRETIDSHLLKTKLFIVGDPFVAAHQVERSFLLDSIFHSLIVH